MDEADRNETRVAHTETAAISLVAIQGVVAICGELVGRGILDPMALGRISDFMLAGLEQSGATAELQASLHESLGHQFSALVRDAPDRNR